MSDLSVEQPQSLLDNTVNNKGRSLEPGHRLKIQRAVRDVIRAEPKTYTYKDVLKAVSNLYPAMEGSPFRYMINRSTLEDPSFLATITKREARILSKTKLKHDAEELKKAENAGIDELTGLNNKNRLQIYLRDKIEGILVASHHEGKELRKRPEAGLGIVFLDIDYFKEVNDILGHIAGDETLRMLAQELRETFRANDMIARWGGEEFMIVPDIGDTAVDEFYKVMESKRKNVSNDLHKFVLNLKKDKTIRTNLAYISGGIYFFSNDEIITLCGEIARDKGKNVNDDDVLQEAINRITEKVDNLLYEAKHNGKNQAYGPEGKLESETATQASKTIEK